MTKEIIQGLADSENLSLNGDFEYFEAELSHWRASVCQMFGEVFENSEKESKGESGENNNENGRVGGIED